jgi:hypothetical protein
MSKLFETAVAKARKLPQAVQDRAALQLLKSFETGSSHADCVSIEAAREAHENGDMVTLAKWRHDIGIGN